MYNQLITAVQKHVSLTNEEMAAFCSPFKPYTYHKKDFLLREGEVCNFEGFVTRGCLRIYAIDTNGYEHILYFATEGWWVTDIDSFTTQAPSLLFIEALEDSEVLQISKLEKERLYQELPIIEKLFRIMTQKTHVALSRRMLSALSQNADERYLGFIQKYPHLEQRLTQQQIAAYLGISHEFLSKIRKRLSQKK
jgi:CRP-like cAMP-binding protein